MTRLRPRAEKAESLFVENLKPFSTASTQLGHQNHIDPVAGVHVLSLRFDAFRGRAGGNVVK
jgi:hypothetical protein